MEWITPKDAAKLVNRSQTVISRFTKRNENTKHIKRKGRSVFINKAFLLSEYSDKPENENQSINPQTETKEPAKEIDELKATIDFLIELQAKTENANADLLKEKDERIKDLKTELEAKRKQIEKDAELYRNDRHELNSIILEQSRMLTKGK